MKNAGHIRRLVSTLDLPTIESKREEREKVKDDIDRFLEAGGKIEHVPRVVCTGSDKWFHQ